MMQPKRDTPREQTRLRMIRLFEDFELLPL